MTRNLKVLGLALVAVFAMSAALASAASAAAPEFTSEINPTTIKGSQTNTNVFSITEKNVSCTTATISGTQSTTPTNNVTVTPAYSGCTVFGFAEAHVITNGCKYKFTMVAGSSPATATAEILGCNAGKGIELTPTLFGSSVCTVTIPAQNIAGGHVIFENSTPKTDLNVNATLSQITATVDGGGGQCGTTGLHTGANGGSYNGKFTVEGFNAANEMKVIDVG